MSEHNAEYYEVQFAQRRQSEERDFPIPRWTRQDEINLRNRVRRMAADERPTYPVVPSEAWASAPAYGCLECAHGNHTHARVQVGPYLICRCLGCPVVTIEGTDE